MRSAFRRLGHRKSLRQQPLIKRRIVQCDGNRQGAFRRPAGGDERQQDRLPEALSPRLLHKGQIDDAGLCPAPIERQLADGITGLLDHEVKGFRKRTAIAQGLRPKLHIQQFFDIGAVRVDHLQVLALIAMQLFQECLVPRPGRSNGQSVRQIGQALQHRDLPPATENTRQSIKSPGVRSPDYFPVRRRLSHPIPSDARRRQRGALGDRAIHRPRHRPLPASPLRPGHCVSGNSRSENRDTASRPIVTRSGTNW